MREINCLTAVIGSGCAGLNAADWLCALGEQDVLLITEKMNYGTSRNTGSDKQTYYKLSLAGSEADSVEEMAQTLKREDVDGELALCEAAGSAQSFLKLVQLGVPFPQNEMGEFVGYQTDHDLRRRASSAGPLTSKYMTQALEKSVLERGVRILENLLVYKILTDEKGVCGVDCLDTEKQEILRIRCAHVLLATGGSAGIYYNRVYPESQFGMSGMAYAAGAVGANLDCWQYGLASVKFRWNVSGSYQQALPRYVSIDEQGNEFDFLSDSLSAGDVLQYTFLKGYQWPFDPRKAEGSSKVDLLVKEQEDLGRKVYLDYLHNPTGYEEALLSKEAYHYLSECDALKETPLERLKAINAPAIELYREHNIDLARELLQISVCAQHQNGGIQVDQNWQTAIPGLYACGEAAGTFGQYRPGGTALNSTQVGSMRAARHIHRHHRELPKVLPEYQPAMVIDRNVGETTVKLQKAMSRSAAFQRDPEEMKAMRALLKELTQELHPLEPDNPDAVDCLQLMDMIRTQQEVLSAMLYACEHQDSGVLETRDGVSTRRAAHPIPERDLWFESVWKKDRSFGN